jgi:hypothetical protein
MLAMHVVYIEAVENIARDKQFPEIILVRYQIFV